jgi:hypothetical protein
VEPLTSERVAALRRRLGDAMDAVVVLARPKADHGTVIARAQDAVRAFLDEAHALAAAPAPPPDAETMPLDPQELWVRADRALVEAYSRALCGNAGAARAAVGDAARTAEEFRRTLRRPGRSAQCFGTLEGAE